MDATEKELDVLQEIYHNRDTVRQRDLAKSSGMSLGMTNAVLKRLALKGWITIRKVNNRNIQYAVSPSGVDAIMKRGYRYLKRTMKNVANYRETLDHLVCRIRDDGYTGISVVGKSDMAFIIEYVCGRNGIEYCCDGDSAADGSVFYLHSESRRNTGKNGLQKNEAYLRDLLIQTQKQK